MPGPAHYRAIDDRGEELLDAIETRLELDPQHLPGTRERVYKLLQLSIDDVDAALTEDDENWRDHVERVTQPPA